MELDRSVNNPTANWTRWKIKWILVWILADLIRLKAYPQSSWLMVWEQFSYNYVLFSNILQLYKWYMCTSKFKHHLIIAANLLANFQGKLGDICGDIGDVEALTTCPKCKDGVEHRYDLFLSHNYYFSFRFILYFHQRKEYELCFKRKKS